MAICNVHNRICLIGRPEFCFENSGIRFRDMKLFRFQHKKGGLSLFGKTMSLVAVLLIGLVSYLASSPEAHEFFHPDADHADHDCAVTAFAAGGGVFLAPHIDPETSAPFVGG